MIHLLSFWDAFGCSLREREQLDLELETTPTESTYSDALMQLMQQEDQAGVMGDFEYRELIAARVDQALAAETHRHFTGQAEKHCHRLTALFQQQVSLPVILRTEIG